MSCFDQHYINHYTTRRPSGVVVNSQTTTAEVVSSILDKTIFIICVLSSVAESVRTRVSKIQPSVDEVQEC